jgi:hypothetical protein
MNKKKLRPALLILMLAWGSAAYARPVSVATTHDSRIISYGLGKLEQVLATYGDHLLSQSLAAEKPSDLVVLLQDDEEARQLNIVANPLGAEGYQLVFQQARLYIIGADEKGVLYGTLDVAEQLRHNGENLALIQEKKEEPRLIFRAIKFNLPMVAYRSSISLTQQENTVLNLQFWEKFLDMMAADRFNVLSLWSMHPFHYMVKSKSFPEACPFDDMEMQAMKHFWSTLFKMAHERGIETYIINWNIFVPPSFAHAHQVALYSVGRSQTGPTNGDTSKIIEQYTRETITTLKSTALLYSGSMKAI